MPSLALSFPGHRYHATPWGSHVNEGQIEWPPSPWRLLRALVSVGYTSGEWNGMGPTPIARRLLEKLSSVLPSYVLPTAIGTHSRHYMPLAKLKSPAGGADTSFVLAHQINARPRVHGHEEDTTLVFDTWAHVDGELFVTWDVLLEFEEHAELQRLVARLGYLGRSESWVDARVLDANEAPPPANCVPDEGKSPPARGSEQVALLAPQSPIEYAVWRGSAVAAALAALPHSEIAVKKLRAKHKKTVDSREKTESAYPADFIAALQTKTAWLRAQGWNQPPGSRRVFYVRRTDALDSQAPQTRRNASPSAPIEAMLLSLSSSSGSKGLLPIASRTLPQAELLHRAIVGIAAKQFGHSPVLSGCDDSGQPFHGPHGHAHVLPLDLDGDSHLDHVLIWAPMRLDAQAQNAVRGVRQTYTKGHSGNLRLALVGTGSLTELSKLSGAEGNRLRALLGTDSATEWTSETPFVPPRYLKKNGRNTLAGQVAAELASRGLPAPIDVRWIDPHDDDLARHHRHYRRCRRFGPSPPVNVGFTLALRFEQPIRGPLCLGYGSHFGLGMFRIGR